MKINILNLEICKLILFSLWDSMGVPTFFIFRGYHNKNLKCILKAYYYCSMCKYYMSLIYDHLLLIIAHNPVQPALFGGKALSLKSNSLQFLCVVLY